MAADTSGGSVVDQSIQLTVANPPSNGIWTRVSLVSGEGVALASVESPSTGSLRLRIESILPRLMGAGTYTSTLRVEVCSDNQCATQLAGSPANVTVTYTVTGNLQSTTRLTWTETFLEGADLVTTETRAPTMKLRITVQDLPPAGIYLRRTAPATGVIAGMVFGTPTFTTTVGQAYGEYTVTLKAPAALGSGLFTDNVQLRACFDDACVREVPNSRYTLSIRTIVTTSPGMEYSRRVYTSPVSGLGATSVVWSAPRQSLYLVASENASNGSFVGLDPRILQIDPLTATAGTQVVLPGENLLHALPSTDGSLLYVSSRNQPSLRRFQLPSLAPDITIPLGSFTQFEPFLVTDMAALPGQPQSVVVAVAHNGNHGGTRVYDNAVLRPDAVALAQGQEFARWLVPGDSPGTFVSQSVGPAFPQFNNMQQLAVDATGIRVSASTASTSGIIIGGDRPQRSGNRLFLRDGRILDATTGAQLGALALPDSSLPRAILVDEPHNRVLVWMDVFQRWFMISFDLTTLQPLAYLPVYAPGELAGTGGRMTLWGNDGLALADGTRLIILSGPFFTSYRGQPTM